jgi:hypothetical protein
MHVLVILQSELSTISSWLIMSKGCHLR